MSLTGHYKCRCSEASRFDFRGVYTVAEVADILKVRPSTIYQLLHSKELPSVRIGKKFRIAKFTLWAYMNGLDHTKLVEDILNQFIVQHCCRDDGCEVRL